MSSSNTSQQRPPQHQLLLGRDLRSACRDLRSDGVETVDEPVAEQLALPGIDPPLARKPRRRPRPAPVALSAAPADDPLLTTFLRRLAAQGRARKGQLAYGYQMRSM